eukprot:6445390-Pyramimonas_sp.AAC.2
MGAQFRRHHPRNLVRTSLHLYCAASPQTHADGLWLHCPKVSAGDRLELDFAAVADPNRSRSIEKFGETKRQTAKAPPC